MKRLLTTFIGTLFTILMLAGTAAYGVVLASYDFDGLSGDEATLAVASTEMNISAGAFSRGVAYGGYEAAFSTNGFGTQPGAATSNTAFLSSYTIDTAMDNGGYFEFTITPASGYEVSIDTITLGSRRASSSTGPNYIAARSSLDGYSANLVAGVSSGGAGGNVSLSTTLDFGDTLQNIASAVTVRLIGYGRGSGSGYGIWVITNPNGSDVNGAGSGNFVVNGSVTAVPEPETYALIVSAMALGVVIWRRRRS